MLLRLASSCSRHRLLVLAAWGAMLVAGVACAPVLFGSLSDDTGSIDGSESAEASERVWRAAPTGTEIYAVVDGLAVDDPALRETVQRTADHVAALPGVRAVHTPWSGPGSELEPHAVAGDRRAVAVAVDFSPRPAGWRAVEPAAEQLRTIDAPRVLVAGEELLDEEMGAQAADDLARAELLSMPIVLMLLVLVFGGVVAAGLPVLVAVVGTGATLGALTLASLATDISVYAVNVVTMLGLGLAVDYALLIVSRFREERAVDPDVHGALQRTYATAGRTIGFSGATVAASLAGLLVFRDAFLQSMGLAGFAVVLLDLAAALTLLPALLSLLGHRIRPNRATSGSRLAVRLAGALRGRRAIAVLIVAVPLLLLVASPFRDVRYADADVRSMPASSESRQTIELLAERFDLRPDVEPVTVVADKLTTPQLATYLRQLRELPGVREVSPRPVPGLTVIDVTPQGPSQGDAAMRLVSTIRTLDTAATVQVTGEAAELSDYQDALRSRLPLAAGLVALATLVLLLAFTGSLVVAVKAIILNLLSLGASFGALVWVFQEGHLGGLVGTDALGSLDISAPVLVFAIAFGLSMDYEVFLLGRIAEEWRRTGDNQQAIVRGLASTARVVTTAALLMAIVFAGFVSGGFSPIKQVGLGLLLAVLVDATVVRMLLLPAAMSLLGRANWWSPAWLRSDTLVGWVHRRDVGRLAADRRALSARATAGSRWHGAGLASARRDARPAGGGQGDPVPRGNPRRRAGHPV